MQPFLVAPELTSSPSFILLNPHRPPFIPRVLSHDVSSSTILLWNESHIVLADISLCLPTRGSAPWLREPRSTVTMLGYLERSQVTSPSFTCLETKTAHEGVVQLPRVSGRRKRARRTFSHWRCCPMKMWCSFGTYRCRRSWCSILRMWI
jgi:hypothetical protein